ncbi:MAG: 50S ribosomal protein L15 [candidate division KSB1 bacterium]|nr:50S ribosomal protein L15 [candidate division KSB1 bacterium]
MDLRDLKPAPGATKKRKRVGCGEGSGHGGTSCRGHKGARSRSGHKSRPWFEGGQMPLQRRVPKRGFTNIFKTEYQIVNVGDLNRLEGVEEVTPEVLKKSGLIKKLDQPVKILGDGELTKALHVLANAFSKSARAKIEAAGGRVTIL